MFRCGSPTRLSGNVSRCKKFPGWFLSPPNRSSKKHANHRNKKHKKKILRSRLPESGNRLFRSKTSFKRLLDQFQQSQQLPDSFRGPFAKQFCSTGSCRNRYRRKVGGLFFTQNKRPGNGSWFIQSNK